MLRHVGEASPVADPGGLTTSQSGMAPTRCEVLAEFHQVLYVFRLHDRYTVRRFLRLALPQEDDGA